MASRVDDFNSYLLPQNYIEFIPCILIIMLHSFQRLKDSVGSKQVYSSQGTLLTQIKFFILKSYEWPVSKSETPELSWVQSFLSSELINPKETDQSICFAFRGRRCWTLSVKPNPNNLRIILQYMLFKISKYLHNSVIPKWQSIKAVYQRFPIHCLK